MTDSRQNIKLTMGPVLYNWEPEVWRDFYFRIAAEADLDTVYLGEAVCSKRLPFLAPHIPEVTERLIDAGKRVVFSSLALVMNKRDGKLVRDLAQSEDIAVEANDMSAVAHLTGKPHIIGPLLNVYNEDTLQVLADNGATRFCLPPELPAQRLAILAAWLEERNLEAELLAYGRVPLALSARCYHARMHGLTKDNCQFICGQDPDGVTITTLDDQPFMTVNGIQTMSYSYLNLAADLRQIREMKFGYLRLSPHSGDMISAVNAFRAALDGKISSRDAFRLLEDLTPDVPASNGFFHETRGHCHTGHLKEKI